MPARSQRWTSTIWDQLTTPSGCSHTTKSATARESCKSKNRPQRGFRTRSSKFLAQSSTRRRPHAPQRPLPSRAARHRSSLTRGAAAGAHPGQLPAVRPARARSPHSRRPAPAGPWARKMLRRVGRGGREMRGRYRCTDRPGQAALGSAGRAATAPAPPSSGRLRRPVELGLQARPMQRAGRPQTWHRAAQGPPPWDQAARARRRRRLGTPRPPAGSILIAGQDDAAKTRMRRSPVPDGTD